MPYIGKNLVGILKDARASDTMTGDGSDTTLTLTDTPGSTNNVLVFLDGIRQTPVTDYWVTGRTLTFTTAPEAGVNVVALTGSASSIDPKMGSVTSMKIVDGMVGNAKIATLSASKLTGALPAISGANLTNTVTSTGIDNVTSDPTISTNPSGGVGTIQLNQVSGEMFVCTDATAGENHWVNVGHGIGNVWEMQGTLHGYSAGGSIGAPNYTSVAAIQKFNFANTSSESDIGNLSSANINAPGHQDRTYGFVAGGYSIPSLNSIQKFNFSGSFSSSDHGDLSMGKHNHVGYSAQTDGYTSGGMPGPTNVIDKFSFASNTTASDHGDLAVAINLPQESQSSSYGYNMGGVIGSTGNDTVQKFAFFSNITATDVANLTTTRSHGAGFSSTVAGYAGTGRTPAGTAGSTSVDKILFASDSSCSDIGDLANTAQLSTGHSSTTNGYIAGGGNTSEVGVTNINTVAFSNDARSTHGNLGTGSWAAAGIHN